MGAAGRRGLLMTGAAAAWQPSDISTVHHWLDGSDISTLWEEPTKTTQATQDSVVGAWDDKITGTPFTQNVFAAKPQCKIDVGGLLFAQDFLSAVKNLVSWVLGAGVNHHIFAITKPTSISGNVIFASAYTSYGFSLEFKTNKVQAAVGNGVDSKSKSVTTASATANVLQLSESAFNNNNNTIRALIDNVYSGGELAWANNVNNHAADDSVSIGALYTSAFSPIALFAGHIYEIILTEEITAGERVNLMEYFNAKYGLTL